MLNQNLHIENHVQRQQEIQRRAQMRQQEQEMREQVQDNEQNESRTFYSPALARLGGVLSGLGETLQERYGEAKFTPPAPNYQHQTETA